MPDTTVKYFDSTMSGAPSLSGTAGALIGVLDACLVNGFGSVTVNSLAVAANVATATVSAGHNFPMVVGSNNVSPGVGMVIAIAGATPIAMNGEWRIASVPNSTTFTFATSGISDQTASGTITAKRAPAGFSKGYSDTNKAAYRADASTSTRLYLRVDDTPAQYPTLIMYESMSDVDTGTGPAPPSGAIYVAKSSSANATARPWRLFADGHAVYLHINADSAYWSSGFFFGDLVQYKSTDGYHCALIGHNAESINYFYLYSLGLTTASWLSRSYTQVGGAVACTRQTHTLIGASMGSTSIAYPNPVYDGFLGWPVEVWENNVSARGLMPGCVAPVTCSGLADAAVIPSVVGAGDGVDGASLLATQFGSGGRVTYVLDRAWR